MNEDIKYNPESHEYTIDGKRLHSVTELASDFSRLDKTWLVAHPEYAARGTVIHAELAEYYEGNKDFDSLSKDAQEIAEHLDPDKRIKSEVIVYNTKLGYAGTADLIAITGTTIKAVVDIKTGRTRNKLYEQCQLSLYMLALKYMGYNTDETKLYILHPDGLTEYQLLSWEKMQQLAEGDLELEPDDMSNIQRLIARMNMLEPFIKDYDEIQSELKELLSAQFEKKGATTFVCNDIKCTYTKGGTRKSVDTLALKKDGLYDKYTKETQVAPSVRITKRKDNE